MIDIKHENQKQLDLTKDTILGFNWENKMTYALWLAQTYHMVCYSTRLVALAGAHCKLSEDKLHQRFVDHSVEERGHEKICIKDLSALGFKIDELPKMYHSLALFQSQYFWIEQVHPSAFFGYTLALESLATEFGQEVYKRVTKAHGEKSTIFLKVHAEDDIDHIRVAYEQMNKLPENLKKNIIENMDVSCSLYRQMLTDIEQKVKSVYQAA